MRWGKHKENMIRVLPFCLRGTRPSRFLWRGHDSFYWRTQWFEMRIMKAAKEQS
jgi:hypothetical protein